MARKAKINEAKEIYKCFRLYKDTFPHLRFDYLHRKIDYGNCIYDKGVAITYTVYKRKNRVGTTFNGLELYAMKGDVMIHQLANANPSNGKSKEVVADFLKKNCKGKKVWLTVRQTNDRACRFYEKMKFEKVGIITWMNGDLHGYVFCYDPNNLKEVL